MTLNSSAGLKMASTSCRGLLVCGVLALSVTVVHPAVAVAQEKQSKDQEALVDGLLDLLSDPATEAIATEPEKSPGQASTEVTRGGEVGSAADANLPAGSSLTSHPLSMVHRSMRSAAERLGSGVVGLGTQKLQGEILQQLDSLIDQLQQQDSAGSSPQSQQPSSTSQSQSSRMPTEEQASSAEQAPADDSQSDGKWQADNGQADSGQAGSGQGAQDRPSQAGGAAANVAVDLADPQRLQQDVWGQLPEQMRKQMQARMVESFLPSYRPQIEAYFRKLLESGNE